MFRPLLLAAAASLGMSACAMNDTGMMAEAAGDMTPTNGQAYTAMAASSDMFEIQSSQIALERSRNANVRMFAQMMIQHHTNTTQQLMAAARAAGVAVPMQMMPMHAQMLSELRASGNVDATYGRQQRTSHQMALALHGNYAARGDTPALRTVAAAATPIVRDHLNRTAQLPR